MMRNAARANTGMGASGSGAALLTRRIFVKTALTACGLLALGGLAGCASAPSEGSVQAAAEPEASDQITETLFVFDTVVTLTASCSEAVMESALDRCRYFEEHFSRTREGSDVWNVNVAGGAPVQVAPETADVIQRGLAFAERSGGLFDITIGAVSSLWDFKEAVRPADDAIAEAVRHVDWRGVQVRDDVVQLDDPQAMLDLGGIAKGYIADDLARLFREAGCASAVINLGGNALVVGAKPDGSDWRVGVQDPNAPTDAGVIAVAECRDASVVTSGLYERVFEEDGVRYHHILDPRTGYPAETDLMSVSVASEASVDGDALATWMFLLGHDAALAFLEEEPGVEALVMDAEGDVRMTAAAPFQLR